MRNTSIKEERGKEQMISIIISIVLGILLGRYSGLPFTYTSEFIQIGLYLLLFFVGLDIGRSDDLLRIFRRMGSEAAVSYTHLKYCRSLLERR